MGFVKNMAISIPMAIIIYMLTEKIIINITSNNIYNDRIQKSFILSFIVGLTYIIIGLTVFSEKSNLDNQALQFAMYMSGLFLIINAVVFNWNNLSDNTKIIILALTTIAFIMYSYTNKRSNVKIISWINNIN